jgi:hypothetical protein
MSRIDPLSDQNGPDPRPVRERRWRTQTHTIPAQVGSQLQCYGLGVYPGPIAYLSMEDWCEEEGDAPPHIGLLPGQVDALINALQDAKMLFEENGHG